MLKQSASRNTRLKGIKVKHILRICVLLAISIWLLNQLKQSYDKKKSLEDITGNTSEKIQSEHEILKLGRKDLHSGVEETNSDTVSQWERAELEEAIEGIKPEETEDERRGGGDDEIDGHDQERATEEEPEEVEDLIDVDNREREEGIAEQEIDEKANELVDASSLDDQVHIVGERNAHEAGEQTISNEFEFRGLRKAKEKEVENYDPVESAQENKSWGIKEDSAESVDADTNVGKKVTIGSKDHDTDVNGYAARANS